MKTVEKILRGICAAVGIFSGAILLGMMILTCANVISRGFFSAAIKGTNEMLENFILLAGFLGIGWVAFMDGHIKVDLVVSHFPMKTQKIFFKINYILASVISFFIALENYNKGTKAMTSHLRTQLLRIPRYPFYYVIAFSYLLCAIALLFLFIKNFLPDENTAQSSSTLDDTQPEAE